MGAQYVVHVEQQEVFLHPHLTHFKFRWGGGGEITEKISYHAAEDGFSFFFFLSPHTAECVLTQAVKIKLKQLLM